MATGTVTFTETRAYSMKTIKAAWIAATGASGGIASAETSFAYTGRCYFFVTVPSATLSPTDNYDITIKDSEGVDVLAGAGADRDTANTEYVLAGSLGSVMQSKLSFTVTNAGSAKAGTIYLHLR